MSKVLVTDTHLSNIGNAIREKNGKSTRYKPGEMAQAIRDIEGGGEDVLPEGYTRLPYIESNGEQYIDTGFSDINGLRMEGRMCFLTGTAANSCLCGVYESNKRASCVLKYQTRDNYAIAYGTVFDYIRNIPIVYDVLNNYIVDNRKCFAFICNDGAAGGNTDTTARTAQHQYLFALNREGIAVDFAKARIDKCLYYDHTLTLVRAFYAARRDSDGKLGLYDTITSAFYTNMGTGSDFTTEAGA